MIDILDFLGLFTLGCIHYLLLDRAREFLPAIDFPLFLFPFSVWDAFDKYYLFAVVVCIPFIWIALIIFIWPLLGDLIERIKDVLGKVEEVLGLGDVEDPHLN